MPESLPRLSAVRFTAADADDRRTGLLGWATCVLGDLVLDGIAVRVTRDRRLTLSFPARRDRSGQQHAFMRPVDDQARRRIEREVLAAIDLADLGGVP